MAHPTVLLRGYRFSVYCRIARMALEEKGVGYGLEEVDPFVPDLPEDYLRRHPFGRVPVLSHSRVDIYETVAITRYIDAAFDGPELMPVAPVAVARVAQVVSILDSYGYGPMVRQVFEHCVFRPATGEAVDADEIAAGLDKAGVVLDALERIAAEGHVLSEGQITLADCHLAPMMAYFTAAPAGATALADHPALSGWWRRMSQRESLAQTDPGLPDAAI